MGESVEKKPATREFMNLEVVRVQIPRARAAPYGPEDWKAKDIVKDYTSSVELLVFRICLNAHICMYYLNDLRLQRGNGFCRSFMTDFEQIVSQFFLIRKSFDEWKCVDFFELAQIQLNAD